LLYELAPSKMKKICRPPVSNWHEPLLPREADKQKDLDSVTLLIPACGLVARAFASQSVETWVSLIQTKRLKKLAFTAFLLDVQHQRYSVEN